MACLDEYGEKLLEARRRLIYELRNAPEELKSCDDDGEEGMGQFFAEFGMGGGDPATAAREMSEALNRSWQEIKKSLSSGAEAYL